VNWNLGIQCLRGSLPILTKVDTVLCQISLRVCDTPKRQELSAKRHGVMPLKT